MDIKVTRFVINNGLLAILDKENGIFFYDVTKLSSNLLPKVDFSFELKDINSFDLKGNTMIIVFGGRFDKVWEIFIDYEKNEYFVNKVYVDDMTYDDVRMDRHFAILMSDAAHRIIPHSIYKDFTHSSLWRKHRYFSEISLRFLILLNYVEDT